MLGMLLDFVFPKRCVSCGMTGIYLCNNCQGKIVFLNETICPMCERPAIDGITHPGCQTRYSLDGLVSFYRYDGPVKAAIKRLKYKPYLAELAEILLQVNSNIEARNSRQSQNTNDRNSKRFEHSDLEHSNLFRVSDFGFRISNNDFVVVPVPLHPQRERERGFNQAALIGKAIAQQLNLPFTDNVLRRTRNTKPQVLLTEKDRRENMKSAFGIDPSARRWLAQDDNLRSENSTQIVNYHEPRTHNSILLVDDVWTTGSTLRSCANVLKRASAKKVWAVTVAR